MVCLIHGLTILWISKVRVAERLQFVGCVRAVEIYPTVFFDPSYVGIAGLIQPHDHPLSRLW